MSKAFTREDDNAPEDPIAPLPRAYLPPGGKNYFTTDGARRLQEELNHLMQTERSAAVVDGDGPEAKARVQRIDRRILWLNESLGSAVVVDLTGQTPDRVRFGASVDVRDSRGVESSYRIVGVDETDIDRGWVSWLSPIAKALNNARLGQRVKFRFPSGEEQLEILRISYKAPA